MVSAGAVTRSVMPIASTDLQKIKPYEASRSRSNKRVPFLTETLRSFGATTK